MLANTERIVEETTNSLIKKVNLQISTLEKANNSKPEYSARKVFKLLGEINDQVTYSPDKQIRLKTPSDLSSLRMDSFMSVFNVENPVKPIRHRSVTKNYGKNRRNTVHSQDELSKANKKQGIYNKIQPLKQSEQEIQKRKKCQQIQEETQDAFRAELQKKLLISPDEKRKTKPKLINIQELKEKFGYDYDSNRIKIKFQAKGVLVSSNKSLTSYVSKGTLTKALPKKLQKPISTFLQTRLVVQKKKKQKKLRKHKNIQQVVSEPVEVQFSKISNLTENMQCQPGVSLNFNGHYLKSRRANTQTDQINKGRQRPIQYSKIDYLLLKKRSSTSLNNIEGLTKRSLNKKSSMETDLQISPSFPNLTINTQRSQRAKNIQKILISNNIMHKYLLTPQSTQKLQSINNSGRQKRPEPIKTQISLDRNDRFNLNYLRGMRNLNTASVVNQKDKQMILTPKYEHRVPYLKVREKLENKMMFIGELKKKFEETLRSSQQSSNLIQN